MRRLIQIRRRRGRIVPVISRIEVSPSVITLDANDRQEFTAIAYDQFDRPINSGGSFQWSTSDPSVAVVDSGGLVEAYAGGSVDIVAAANGVTGSAALVVEGEVADVVASYDQILLLNPDVDVMFRLPRYRGQQILFQDPNCTVPVNSPGDPIGGVLSIDTLERTAFAETSTDRFVWLGEDQGAHMNKDRLTIDKDPEYWDFLKDGMWTIASGTKVVSEADGSGWRALYGRGATASSRTRNIQFNYGHPTPRYYAAGYNTGTPLLIDEEIIFDQYQGLVLTSDGTYLNFFQDKQEGPEYHAIDPDWVDPGPSNVPFYIGGNAFASYNFKGVSSGFIFLKEHADASLANELTDLLTVGLKND